MKLQRSHGSYRLSPMRRGGAVPRRAHNPQAVSSNLTAGKRCFTSGEAQPGTVSSVGGPQFGTFMSSFQNGVLDTNVPSHFFAYLA